MKIKIEDDFLAQEDFAKIQEVIMQPLKFGWFLNTTIDYKDDKDKFQFVHVFYSNLGWHGIYGSMLSPIIDILNPLSLYRIKSNLLTRTPDIVQNAFHVDINVSEKKLKQFTTSIFYMNTNNGYTLFENGTKIESVANRMITFPTNMKHTGTSCTDENTRVVINFNYFK